MLGSSSAIDMPLARRARARHHGLPARNGISDTRVRVALSAQGPQARTLSLYPSQGVRSRVDDDPQCRNPRLCRSPKSRPPPPLAHSRGALSSRQGPCRLPRRVSRLPIRLPPRSRAQTSVYWLLRTTSQLWASRVQRHSSSQALPHAPTPPTPPTIPPGRSPPIRQNNRLCLNAFRSPQSESSAQVPVTTSVPLPRWAVPRRRPVRQTYSYPTTHAASL